MVSSNTKRRLISWLSLGFVALAIAVFGWGTGYKLSLYYPPNSSAHLLPHAKLLSKNEQEASKNETQTDSPRKNLPYSGTAQLPFTLFLLYALAAAVACIMPALSQREREASRRLYQRLRTSLNYFFVLPPPVLA